MVESKSFILKSTRFGDMEVAEESVIEISAGLIGFPESKRFVMLDHKAPFSWLHAIDDPNLAFVVVDGSFIVEKFNIKIPYGDTSIDLKEDDDFAILSIVTVRGGLVGTTANIKAPLFVNIRNRKGTQIIFDNPDLSTRHPLVTQEEETQEPEKSTAKKDPAKKDEGK